MAQLKLRRAALVLVLASALLPVSAASAAPRQRTHPRPAVSSGSGIARWIQGTVIDLLAKSGIRIDPNGNH